MKNEKDPLEEIELDSTEQPEITEDEGLSEEDISSFEEIQADSGGLKEVTELDTAAEEIVVPEEIGSDLEPQAAVTELETGDAGEKPAEATQLDSTEKTVMAESETGGEEAPAVTQLESDEPAETPKTVVSDGATVVGEVKKEESFFEKYKLPIIIGGAALLLIIALILFMLLGNGDKQVAVQDDTEGIQTAIAEFSYELYPFPNRSSRIGRLVPKLKKFEKELAEKIKNLPEDKKVIIYGHTSREKKKQIAKKERGNERLSTRRARAVIKYLVEKYDIDEDKFEIKAIGSKELKVEKPTWSPKNRRVQIAVEE